MALTTPIRILIADSHRLFAEALAMALEERFDIDVLPRFPSSAREVEADVAALKPDVLLLDYWIRGMEGPTAVARILNVAPGQKIVLLCWFHSPGQVMTGLSAGASAALHKGATVHEVADAVRQVYRGERMILRTTTREKMESEGEKGPPPPALDLPSLTPREVQILHLLSRGLSPQTIAVRLSIKLPTTRTHINNILRKTGTESALDAVSYAIKAGVIR